MIKTSRLLLIILALSINASMLAQNKPLPNDTIYADTDMPAMSTKVSMEIDRKLFPKLQGGIFISENPRAIIMPMVLRADFDSLQYESLLDATAKELNIIVNKQGILNKKGKKVYYISGKTNEKERNVIVEVYYVKADKFRTIMITGFYDLSVKNKYKKVIKRAAFSASLE